jgi:hypothetical protein
MQREMRYEFLNALLDPNPDGKQIQWEMHFGFLNA